MSWSSLLADGALGVLAAPLAVAGPAKLLARPNVLPWPSFTGLLAEPHGPRLVGAVELATVPALLLLPGRFAALLGVAIYLVLTLVAYRLRGRRCACFGVARLAAVGRGHLAANAAATLLAAAVLPVAGPATPGPRLAVLAPAALLIAGLVWRAGRTGAAPCTELIHGVRVFVSEDCPACRSLRALLSRLDESRRATVHIVVVNGQDDLPEGLRGLGVPSATALDATGAVVCPPVSGVGDVKAMVDRAVIGVGVHAYAG